MSAQLTTEPPPWFKLIRPLAWIDLETTGVHPSHDRIVQAAVIKWYPDGRRTTWQSLVNPTVAIPPQATRIHGITDADVRDSPTFASLAPMLAAALRDCDYAGFGLKFDVKVFVAEFRRAKIEMVPGLMDGRQIDAYRIFQVYHPRNLTAAVLEYLGVEMEGAHRADVDIEYTERVGIMQLARHQDLPRDVESLYWRLVGDDNPDNVDPEGKFAWRFDEAVVNFGNKWPTTPLRVVVKKDPGFLRWMLSGDFAPETQRVAREALAGQFPVKGEKADGAIHAEGLGAGAADKSHAGGVADTGASADVVGAGVPGVADGSVGERQDVVGEAGGKAPVDL